MGLVQGVGMRYHILRVAEHFSLTGTVRNQMDGSVKIIAEGDRRQLDEFLEKVKTASPGDISDLRVLSSAATREFDRFSIRH